VRANGPFSANGDAAGGRVAVAFNPAAQAAVAKPRVLFSVSRGLATIADSWYDMGTLYFPDASVLDPTWLPHTGQVWMATNAWSVGSLSVVGLVRLTPDDFRLTVSNDLVVSGAAARLELGGNQVVTNIGVGLNYLMSGTNGPRVTVGGNLTLTNGGTLLVFAGMTNAATTNWGALVDVAGDVNFGNASWIYPYSHPTNGGSVQFRMRNLTCPTNAGFCADYRGFSGGWGNSPHTTGWGQGAPAGLVAGGGYGGRGADYSTTMGGWPYGSITNPVDPGSGGSGEAGVNGGNAGGLVWIVASGQVTMNGTLGADGAYGGDGAGSAAA